ncbi:MAG: sodium:calcium antiporter [Nitrospirae bacterium]|nr:MAG: sodium:calcium antiporter [Nitrospirota bacterium]
MEFAVLLGALVVILLGAETFTNALEHLGERLGISEGVTGSIFAAVGTALPETMVPIFAILSGTGSIEVRHEVGIGAILGAPLMLSTLSLFLMGAFAASRRGWKGLLRPERTGLSRDLLWFSVAFGLGVLAALLPADWMLARGSMAVMLTLLYGMYLFLTIQASAQLVNEGHGTEADRSLYLTRIGLPNHLGMVLGQLAIGFVLIMFGAKGFVYGIEHLAKWLGISALSLSVLIIPVATELPEKVNSILWIRRGRDTLAFGNITGAMVFQGSLLPALGILLTPWVPQREVVIGMVITLIAAVYLLVMVRCRTLRVYHLVINGLCYLGFCLSVVMGQ